MIFAKGDKSGLTWHDLCEFMKAVTEAGGNEVQFAVIRAEVNFRGRLTKITIDADKTKPRDDR